MRQARAVSALRRTVWQSYSCNLAKVVVNQNCERSRGTIRKEYREGALIAAGVLHAGRFIVSRSQLHPQVRQRIASSPASLPPAMIRCAAGSIRFLQRYPQRAVVDVAQAQPYSNTKRLHEASKEIDGKVRSRCLKQTLSLSIDRILGSSLEESEPGVPCKDFALHLACCLLLCIVLPCVRRAGFRWAHVAPHPAARLHQL